MPRKPEQINGLKKLFQTYPELLQGFLRELGVGETIVEPAGTFRCPSCAATIQFSISTAAGGGTGTRKGRQPQAEINSLVIQLARLRGTMTGKIHAEFTKKLGAQAKKITKQEYRTRKEQWLRAEITKAQNKTTSAA